MNATTTDMFFNALTLFDTYLFFFLHRKNLLERRDEPDYEPMPEAERPGGYNFGGGENVQGDNQDNLDDRDD